MGYLPGTERLNSRFELDHARSPERGAHSLRPVPTKPANSQRPRETAASLPPVRGKLDSASGVGFRRLSGDLGERDLEAALLEYLVCELGHDQLLGSSATWMLLMSCRNLT